MIIICGKTIAEVERDLEMAKAAIATGAPIGVGGATMTDVEQAMRGLHTALGEHNAPIDNPNYTSPCGCNCENGCSCYEEEEEDEDVCPECGATYDQGWCGDYCESCCYNYDDEDEEEDEEDEDEAENILASLANLAKTVGITAEDIDRFAKEYKIYDAPAVAILKALMGH